MAKNTKTYDDKKIRYNLALSPATRKKGEDAVSRHHLRSFSEYVGRLIERDCEGGQEWGEDTGTRLLRLEHVVFKTLSSFNFSPAKKDFAEVSPSVVARKIGPRRPTDSPQTRHTNRP